MDKSHLQNYNISFHIAGTPYQQAGTFSQVSGTSHQQQSQCQQVPATQQVMQQPMQYVPAHQINQQLQFQLAQGRLPLTGAQQQQQPQQQQPQQQPQQQIVAPQQQPSYEHMFHAQGVNKGHQVAVVPQGNHQPAPSKDKDLDSIQNAHLEEVRKLQDRIKQLEREKEEKEKLYDRIQRRIRTDQKEVLVAQQEAIIPESDDDGVEVSQTFCPSPERSYSSCSVIKEEPVDNPPPTTENLTKEESGKPEAGKCATPGCKGIGHITGLYSHHWSVADCPRREKCPTPGCDGAGHAKGVYSHHWTLSGCPRKEIICVSEIAPKIGEDTPIEDMTEIQLISHKKITDFSLCIICQEHKDEKLSILTKDGIKGFRRKVANRNDERSQILMREIKDVDTFLDSIPQYHLSCKGKFKSTIKIDTSPLETNFTLCVICQDNSGEPLLNVTERGFPTIKFAALHRDDPAAKRLRLSVKSEEKFLSSKPKMHATCRKYTNRKCILRKMEAAKNRPEPKEEVETEPKLSGEELLKLLREYRELKENSKPGPLDLSTIKFETHCFICKKRKLYKKGKVSLQWITAEKCEDMKNKAEEISDENMLLITNSTDEPEEKLQYHRQCFVTYLKREPPNKVHLKNLPYDIAFTYIVKRIEEPLFIQGKAFDICELTEEYKHYVSEQGVTSKLKSCKMMEKLKKYYTISKDNCVVKVSRPGLKRNIIFSKHLTQEDIDAEVERLERIKKNIKNDESDNENDEEGAHVTDLLGENVVSYGNNSKIKINRIFTKYKKEKNKKPKVMKHKCSECEFRCAHRNTLLKHVKKHVDGTLNEPSISTLCPTCGKSFRNKAACNSHMLTHGEKQFTCTFCGKMFYTKDGMKGHELIHTGEKKYQCNICDMRFLKAYYLTRHKRTHSDERPFVCTVCGYACKDRERLKEHSVKHSDVNPYVCDYCGKSYKYRSVFRYHKYTHTGKPQKCNICGFTCYTKVKLAKHMETHGEGHGEGHSEGQSMKFKNQVTEYTFVKRKPQMKAPQNFSKNAQNFAKAVHNFKDIVTDTDSESSNSNSSYPHPQAQAPQVEHHNSNPNTINNPINNTLNNTINTTNITAAIPPWVYFPTGTLPQYYIPNCEDIKFK